jgi:hypothetical protein
MLRISAAWAVSAVPAGAALSCLHVVRRVVCEGPQQALWPEDLVGAAEGEV